MKRFQLRIMAWNGLIKNCILYWADRGFRQSPAELAAELTEITQGLYHADIAALFAQGYEYAS